MLVDANQQFDRTPIIVVVWGNGVNGPNCLQLHEKSFSYRNLNLRLLLTYFSVILVSFQHFDIFVQRTSNHCHLTYSALQPNGVYLQLQRSVGPIPLFLLHQYFGNPVISPHSGYVVRNLQNTNTESLREPSDCIQPRQHHISIY
jgi:hypothetical protein